MKTLEELLRLDKTIRVIGFDDAPFEKRRGAPVNLAGIVCAQVRFEGMLWGEIKRDGDGATEAIIELLGNSKFADQVHIILTDGLAFGGFNLIDLPRLAEALGRPCVAVMRKLPDMDAIDRALENFEDAERRRELIARAGEIHHHEPFYFQVAGANPEVVGQALERLTDQGHVPEALRLAHIIGAAIKTGESSNRA